MGANYYWTEGEDKKVFHIGKASFGWAFSLHVGETGTAYADYPRDLDEWKALFSTGGKIYDEYNSEIAVQELIDTIICNRSYSMKVLTPKKELREKGCFIEDATGLLRNCVDNRHCISNGEGTYDLIIGDFS